MFTLNFLDIKTIRIKLADMASTRLGPCAERRDSVERDIPSTDTEI